MLVGAIGLALAAGAAARRQDDAVVWDGETVYTRAHALVVSVSEGVDAIPGAKRDGDEFVRLLTSSFQYRRSNVRRLDGADATVANVRKWFAEEAPKIGPNDSALIVFSTHGVDDGQGGYFAMYGAKETAKIAMKEVAAMLKTVPGKHVAFIADACHSGLMFAHARGSRSGGKNSLLRYYIQEPCHRIVASAADAESAIGDSVQGGRFSFQLLKELAAVSDTKAPVTLDDVIRPIKTTLAGMNQHVDCQRFAKGDGAENGEFLFVPDPETARDGDAPQSEGARKRIEEAATSDEVLAALKADGSWQSYRDATAKLLALRRVDLAVDAARRATELKPDHPMIRAMYGIVLGWAGRGSEMIRCIEAYERDFGLDLYLVAMREVIRNVRPTEAAPYAMYSKLIASDPSNGIYRQALAVRAAQDGNLAVARDQLNGLALYNGFTGRNAVDLWPHFDGAISLLYEARSHDPSFNGASILVTLDKAILLLGANRFDEVEKLPTDSASTRRVRAALEWMKMLARAGARDYAAMHRRLESCLAILRELPRAVDETSKVKGAFPPGVLSAVESCRYLDPENVSRATDDEEIDVAWDRPDDLIFFNDLPQVRSVLAGLAQTLGMDAALRSRKGPQLVSQLRESGASLSLVRFLSRKLASDIKEGTEEAKRGDGTFEYESPNTFLFLHGARIQARLSLYEAAPDGVQIPSASPGGVTDPLLLAADAMLLMFVERFSAPPMLKAVNANERRTLIALFESFRARRPDDYRLREALYTLDRLEGRRVEAERVRAECAETWPWLKLDR